MAADRIIKWYTAGAVVGVAAVVAMAAYEHAYDLVRAHGEAGWAAQLVPLTVDGLIYASSMVMLDPACRKAPAPGLASWLLGLGITVTLTANVAHGLGHGLIGAAVAARPAVALVGSYELLRLIIRGAQSREAEANVAGAEPARAGGGPAPGPGHGRVRRPDSVENRPVDPGNPGQTACRAASRAAGPRLPCQDMR
jgi:uncharacterized protein DUF2637